MPLPRYQAGPPESTGSRVGATLLGATILCGAMVYLASTVPGPDRLGAVTLAAIGIFIVVTFAAIALLTAKKSSPPNDAPAPTPGTDTPRKNESQSK